MLVENQNSIFIEKPKWMITLIQWQETWVYWGIHTSKLETYYAYERVNIVLKYLWNERRKFSSKCMYVIHMYHGYKMVSFYLVEIDEYINRIYTSMQEYEQLDNGIK